MIRTAPLLTLTPPLTLPSPLRGEGFVSRTSLASLGEVFGADEYLPGLRPLAGADDVVLLHHVDEARGLGIAEAEPPLQKRDGRRALGDDEVHRVPVDVVTLGASAAPVLLHHGQLDLLVHRGALLAQELADGLHLVVGDPAAVHPRLARGARRHEDHVPAAEELLGAVAVEDGARVHL